jgi:hypothetical protein
MPRYYSLIEERKEEPFDVVMPRNNEQEFIEFALLLGYKKIIFLSDNINYKYDSKLIKVEKAYLCKDTNKIATAKNKFKYVFAYADRKFFESRVDFIMNSELSERRDSFHYRSTLLNQVHAKLAKENSINIAFNFGLLKNDLRKYLGRMMQNAVLVRKYKLNYSAFSFAQTPTEMKSQTILNGFLKVLRL